MTPGRYRRTIVMMRHPRRLFVTGGSGFLGRHIVDGPASEGWEVIAPTSRSLDLRDAVSVHEMIAGRQPAAIIHTAYRKDDRTSIVDASRHVASAAARCGARLVHVSTDALFAGRLAPYTEADEPTAVHDYGRDKADAEREVAAACPSAVIVRTSLLYGVHELSGHERAVRDAVSGTSSMTFFTDEVRSALLVDDLAVALVALADRSEPSGVLNLTGPDPLSRAELATMTARRHGWDASRLRFSTIEESGMTRPGHVVLDSTLAAGHGLEVRGPASW